MQIGLGMNKPEQREGAEHEATDGQRRRALAGPWWYETCQDTHSFTTSFLGADKDARRATALYAEAATEHSRA